MRQKEASGNLHNPLCTDKKGHKGQKRKPLLATFMDCPWTVMDCRKAAAARLSGKSAEAAVEGDTKAHISSLFEISWDNLWRLSSLLPWSFFICSSWDFESRRLLIFPKLPKDCPTLVNLKPDLHDVSIFQHHAECTGQCFMLVLYSGSIFGCWPQLLLRVESLLILSNFGFQRVGHCCRGEWRPPGDCRRSLETWGRRLANPSETSR